MSDIIDSLKDSLKESLEKYRHRRRRTLSKGIRLDSATYGRLVSLLTLIREKAKPDDRLRQCLDANRYTVSSLVYCIVIEELPIIEMKYK